MPIAKIPDKVTLLGRAYHHLLYASNPPPPICAKLVILYLYKTILQVTISPSSHCHP